MLKWLKWKLAGAELVRLERWEQAWQEHDRWLALSSPEAELVLRNLKAHVDGRALDMCWPPGKDGPWRVDGLREVLKRREAPAHCAACRTQDECKVFGCDDAPALTKGGA